jgi:NAD(P)-dependent dehydrogenase (short-subunit alcohol dehydrogenase family)
MQPLDGKTALVTGGSRGIGRAVCQALARDGANIILHYNNNLTAAEHTAASIRADVRLVQADMGSIAQIEAMFTELANVRIDFLINNAGIWRNTPMGATTAQEVDEMLHTNLRGPFWVTQCALPLMNDGGRIVNLSSVAGRIGTPAGRSLYGATKAGIDSLTKNWALELAPRRILVNAIAPGYIATEMTEGFFSNPANLESAIRRQPMGKIGTAEEVADVVAFLCSDGARFISGQSINVSGGSIV